MIENFRILREIQSLIKKENDLLNEEMGSNSRVINIQKRIDGAISEKQSKQLEESERCIKLEQLEILLTNKIEELAQLQKSENFLSSEKQLQLWENQKKQCEESKSQIENDIFELMQVSEEEENEINELDEFIQGATKSLQEIQLEVLAENNETLQKIESLKKRITTLVEELPSLFQEKYLKAQKRNPLNCLSLVSQGKCQHCYFQLSSFNKEKVENHFELMNCQNCGRILLPSAINL